jgi:hypothetical protein
MGIFDKYEAHNWPHRYAVQIHLEDIAGGTPGDPKTLDWHLKNRLSDNVVEVEIQELAAEIMAEFDATPDEALNKAIEAYTSQRGLTRFRRDGERGLYIQFFQIEACIKAAGNIALNAGLLKAQGAKKAGWGATGKGWLSWCPEHIKCIDRRIYLDRMEADSVDTSFPPVRAPGGVTRAIKYTEVCRDVTLRFTLETDFDLHEATWGAIWTHAQREGLGADRKHYGRFEVTGWEVQNLAEAVVS